MALKDWSIGKIVGVMFASFFAVLIGAMVVANVVKKQRAESSMASAAPTVPVSPGIDTSVRNAPAQARNDGLSDNQLSQLSDKLDTLQQQMDKQGQQTQQNNQSIMQNFVAIAGEVKALTARVSALEHPATGDVQVVKPKEKPRVSKVKRLAHKAKPIPLRSGYQAEAVVGKRAWLRVNGVETTRAVGEDLPQASNPARIEAMSADSGVYVVPVKP